jgi:hypothetical protein
MFINVLRYAYDAIRQKKQALGALYTLTPRASTHDRGEAGAGAVVEP